MRILDVTKSLCPHCFKRIDADIVREDGKIYMDKTCPEHGNFKVLIWSDASSYKEWGKHSAYAPRNEGGQPIDKECPYDCGYCNEHRGSTCTAVIEVTQRCQMNCNVCFANATSKGEDLPLEKVYRMIDYVASTQGFCSLQLSGGEPTLRDDLPEIVSYAKGIGFKHVQVNSNGLRLAKDLAYVQTLANAGTDLIYLGFDGADDGVYERIRNRKMMDVKRGTIKNCKTTGIGVILVPVIIKEDNDNQIGDIIEFAKENMPTVKGIHFQPASTFGRYEFEPDLEKRYTIPDLIKDLEEQTNNQIMFHHIVPRKKKSAYCSFSSTYYLDFDNNLVPLTGRRPKSSGDNKKAKLLNEGIKSTTACECNTGLTKSINVKSLKVKSNSMKLNEVNSSLEQSGKMEAFARNTNNFTEKFWTQNTRRPKPDDNKLQAFSKRLQNYTLAISGMPFQDAYNIDLDRIKSCCVSVIHKDLRTVPLCLNYLTDVKGNRLYKEGVCTYES